MRSSRPWGRVLAFFGEGRPVRGSGGRSLRADRLYGHLLPCRHKLLPHDDDSGPRGQARDPGRVGLLPHDRNRRKAHHVPPPTIRTPKVPASSRVKAAGEILCAGSGVPEKARVAVRPARTACAGLGTRTFTRKVRAVSPATGAMKAKRPDTSRPSKRRTVAACPASRCPTCCSEA